jgi:hypothetical protein
MVISKREPFLVSFYYFFTLIEQPIALVVAGEGSCPFSIAAIAFSRYLVVTCCSRRVISYWTPFKTDGRLSPEVNWFF